MPSSQTELTRRKIYPIDPRLFLAVDSASNLDTEQTRCADYVLCRDRASRSSNPGRYRLVHSSICFLGGKGYHGRTQSLQVRRSADVPDVRARIERLGVLSVPYSSKSLLSGLTANLRLHTTFRYTKYLSGSFRDTRDRRVLCVWVLFSLRAANAGGFGSRRRNCLQRVVLPLRTGFAGRPGQDYSAAVHSELGRAARWETARLSAIPLESESLSAQICAGALFCGGTPSIGLLPILCGELPAGRTGGSRARQPGAWGPKTMFQPTARHYLA